MTSDDINEKLVSGGVGNHFLFDTEDKLLSSIKFISIYLKEVYGKDLEQLS